MRLYRIVISDPASGQVYTPPGFEGLLGGASYASQVNNAPLPNAWNVVLDVPVIGQATPQGNALVRVWGISLQEITQANNLVGKNISVFGGMQKGLPLANPAQAGLLAKGTIFQAFGNWIGVDQTLDLVVIPGTSTASAPGGPGSLDAPKNIVLNWKAGTPLSQALKQALSTAFPKYPATVSVSANIVRQNDETGYFSTLGQLAAYVLETSKEIVKTKDYPGASIVLANDAISVSDGTQGGAAAKAISFFDLIGQPTWIQAPNIQFHTVMRADLNVWDKITMPPTLVTNAQQANSSLVNQRASFQGGFRIVSERHVGDFRNPSADAWVTVFEAAPNVVSGT